jgi:hypothetical protein
MQRPGRPPVRMVRLLRRPQDDDGSFDLEFWRRVGPEGRFEAMHDLVIEAQLMRGGDASEPRLQRSVVRVERR